MQHYMQYGLGFCGSVLTEQEYQTLSSNLDYSNSEVRLEIVSFTEDNSERGWCTIVLMPLGELPNYGKMVSLSELSKVASKYKEIDKQTKENILKELEKYNLAHLIDKVEFIIYSDNY